VRDRPIQGQRDSLFHNAHDKQKYAFVKLPRLSVRRSPGWAVLDNTAYVTH
jgi:hypothetical protein